MTKTLILVAVFQMIAALSQPCYGAKTDEGYLDGYSLGITFRQLELGDFKIVDFPFIEARIPLGTDVVRLGYGGHLMWGLTDFFVEWTYAGGIHVYPFGQFFSLNTTGRLGTSLFDNFTYMGSIGINLEIPFGRDLVVSLGAEYFYRNSRDLFDYISFPQSSLGSLRGDKKKEAINLDSRGIGVSIGFRF